MKKYFCDKCKKEVSELIDIRIDISDKKYKDIEICDNCYKEFQSEKYEAIKKIHSKFLSTM